MLKEKVEEKTIELNNQIRLMQESQQIVYDQMQSKINGYLKVIKAKKMMKNEEAIEQLEKVKEIVKHFCEIHSDDYYGVKSQVMGINQDVCECIDQQINDLKVKVEE